MNMPTKAQTRSKLRVRVPYRVIANSHKDQAAGLDISLLFSSGMRKTKVRKLTS
jgi:hypothetical protein